MINKFKKTLELEVFIFDGTNLEKLKKWSKDKLNHNFYHLDSSFKINKKNEVTFADRFYFGAGTIKLPVYFFMGEKFFCALSQKQFLDSWYKK